VGWGEKKLKDFVVKSGLSSSLESGANNRNGMNGSRRRTEDQTLSYREEANLEVDIRSLFSIACVAVQFYSTSIDGFIPAIHNS
jgi:hypothetical protein